MKNVRDFTRYAAAAHRLGVSCLAEMLFYSNDEYEGHPERRDELLIDGCRMAMECGADVLKTPYPTDASVLTDIVDHLGVPTFVLGGPKADGARFVDSMQALKKTPVCGVMLGRNIWQCPDMTGTIAQVAGALGVKPRLYS